MSNLKQILQQDYSLKTKVELVDFMKGLQTLISPEEYGKVSGVQPDELLQLTKKEILAVINDFNTQYVEKWESNISTLPASVLKTISTLIANDDLLFSTAGVADADFAAELGSIDFEKLIGGPLNACVTAQTNASMATVNFIQKVGFDEDKKLRMVDFSHKKVKANPNLGKIIPDDVPVGTDVTSVTIEEEVSLTVPFVSVLSIPSLRIETCDINFNVKLNSVYSKDVSSELGIDASVSGGWGPVKFKVSASYKRSSATGVKVEKEYTMGVKVVATNDEMPGGLEKVLGILSE
jgi:hypothetical protein